jgi:hypothetical protein
VKYLFCFGFETPDQYENNRRYGYDDEDSHAIWIEANSKDEAMAEGFRFARGFIERQFTELGQSMPFEWNENTYACWIEGDPKKICKSKAHSL